jgi:hypothetical protein
VALALEAAGVAAEGAAAAQDAVAGDDDRDRVGAERVARGADRADVARGLGDAAVGARRAERDLCGRLEQAAGERAADEREVDRQREVVAAAVEVLVELAAHVVEARRCLEDARRQARGERFEHGVEAAVELLVGQAGQAARGAGGDDAADGRVDLGVGDVEQARGRRPRDVEGGGGAGGGREGHGR